MKKIVLKITLLLFTITMQSQEVEKLSKVEFYLKGVDNMDKNDYPKAIADFTNALNCNYIKPSENKLDEYEIYNYRGQAYFYIKDFQNAMKDYNSAIQNSNPEEMKIEVYNNRGFLKMQLSDFRGAILDYNFVIERYHTVSKKYGIQIASTVYKELVRTAYSDKSFCNYKLKNLDEALYNSEQALILDINDGQAYCIRGACKYSQGKKDEACLDFSKSGELGYQLAYNYIKNYCN